jgi:rare lipoprotein A
MRYLSLALTVALLGLAACDSSDRPVYSGHQESTEGVPGFVNGKKVSPNVKLGQSYTIAGETYVPRHQPDYVEEGLASWYGPGFHGGKTANGERFDKNEMTAAHRTLPLPSIVRVTMLSNGKQVFVRINDRGPFSKGRIIDLSRGAAEKIGLLGVGVAKVRVEYMEKESQRFADLLADGRNPKSIDLASEVLDYSKRDRIDIARTDVRVQDNDAESVRAASREPKRSPSFWDNFGDDMSAEESEGEYPNKTVDAAPVSSVERAELPASAVPRVPSSARVTAAPLTTPEPPSAPVAEISVIEPEPEMAVTAEPEPEVVQEPDPAPMQDPNSPDMAEASPFAVLETAAGQDEMAVASAPITGDPVPVMQAMPAAPASAAPMAASSVAGAEKVYVQLGAFQSRANAEKVRKQFSKITELMVVEKPNAAGAKLYHVRMGPYSTADTSNSALNKARQLGADAKLVREH